MLLFHLDISHCV